MFHDMTKPHNQGDVTDGVINALLELFSKCEKERGWPEAWRRPGPACIANKKKRNFQLIALLHVANRAWANNAIRKVPKWMTESNREWIACGPECAAEDTAYEICPRTDAADDEDKSTTTMISDLEKALRESHA